MHNQEFFKTMKVLFIGHSHLKVLNDSYQDDIIMSYIPNFVQCGLEQYKPNIKKSLLSSKKILNKSLRKKITDKSFFSVVSCIFGNVHNIIGFFKNEEPFDFVIPGREDLPIDADCAHVPFEIIKARINESLENFNHLLKLISESSFSKVYHLEPPPVIPSNDFIAKHFSERTKKYKNSTINSYICRHKIWILHSELMKKICDLHNVYFIKNPSSIFDKENKLLEQYWCETCTHGNSKYGLEVLKNFDQILTNEKSI